MKTICFQHKCRQCGVVTDDTRLGGDHRNKATIILLDSIAGLTKEPGAPQLISLHCCDNNNIGLADLIGFVVKDMP